MNNRRASIMSNVASIKTGRDSPIPTAGPQTPHAAPASVMNNHMSGIFWFEAPEAYFDAVDHMMMIISFYYGK